VARFLDAELLVAATLACSSSLLAQFAMGVSGETVVFDGRLPLINDKLDSYWQQPQLTLPLESTVRVARHCGQNGQAIVLFSLFLERAVSGELSLL
jgi:hypothetical protein